MLIPLVCLVFPKVFFVISKNLRENQKKTRKYPRVGLKPLKTLFVFVFPNVCFVFFGVILYCWFSLMFFLFSKNLRENQKNEKQNPYPRVGLKPLKTLLCFLMFVWCSLVFFYMFGFPECFFMFFVYIRENQKKKQDKNHIQTQGEQGRNNSLTKE